MVCGVKEDSERLARLMVVLGRAESEHRCLRIVVVDDDVDVHLLWHVLAGPLRWPAL